MDEHEFMVLAKKFAGHNTKHGDSDCMVCEGIEAIMGGQFELEAIADATGFDDDHIGYRGDQ